MEENLKALGETLRDKECPELYRNILQIQDTLDVLSGKWEIPILFAVLKGHSRFSDILAFCPGLTDKVLDNRLKDLIANRLIEKRENGYIMTEHGISLYRVIQELCRWGCRHRHVMLGEPLSKDIFSDPLT